MEEDINFLERRIKLNSQMYLEFGRLLSLDEETTTAIKNLINKYKEQKRDIQASHILLAKYSQKNEEQEKIIELMADMIYKTTDTLNMLDIGKEVNYDLEKLFNGIDDKEAIKIIIDYFKKKARTSDEL